MFRRSSSTATTISSITGKPSSDNSILADPLPDVYASSDSEEEVNYKSSPSKDKQIRHNNNRSVVDQLRYWFLTGKLTQVVLQGALLVVVAVNSYALSKHLFRVGWPNSSGSYWWSSPSTFSSKPLMVGMYFQDVASSSFSGHVLPIPVPQSHQQWMKLLDDTHRLDGPSKRRLQKQQQQQHGSHRNILKEVKPLSTKIDSIAEGSEDYEEDKPDITPYPDRCQPQYDWQTHTFPTCNSVHEVTMMHDRMYLESLELQPQRPATPQKGANSHLRSSSKPTKERRLSEKVKLHRDPTPKRHEQFKMLANGYWRDTWMFQYPLAHSKAGQASHGGELPVERLAFKTIRTKHDTSEYLLDKQRRDSVTSDRLQFSTHAIHMYSYCGTSALYEWAPGGDLEKLIEQFEPTTDFIKFYSLEERYQLAYNVTVALTDVHTTEGSDKPPAIIHADFKADQFVAVTPIDWTSLQKEHRHKKGVSHKLPEYKLGDFNLARFPYWDTKRDRICPVDTDGNGGELRAPEEYNEDRGLSAKLDIYSLGNLLYTLLTGYFPFDDWGSGHETAEMKKLVKKGKRPHINVDVDYTHSKDPMIKALVKAIKWCWEQDPNDRPKAQQLEDLLAEHLPEGIPRIPRRR